LAIHTNQGLRVQQSFALLLAQPCQYGPENYMLNISSGHNASAEMVKYESLPYHTRRVYRGEIGAKPVHGSKERTI
jgi:hypothetical protein